jgi:EF hand domain-containing protein
MKKLAYSNIATYSISSQNIKDIQTLSAVIVLIAFVLFSFNFQALAGGTNDKGVAPISPLPTQTSKAKISDFSKLDIDQDGKLSRAEAANDDVLMNGFDVIDTDVSGSIDSSEYSVYILTTTPN